MVISGMFIGIGRTQWYFAEYGRHVHHPWTKSLSEQSGDISKLS